MRAGGPGRVHKGPVEIERVGHGDHRLRRAVEERGVVHVHGERHLLKLYRRAVRVEQAWANESVLFVCLTAGVPDIVDEKNQAVCRATLRRCAKERQYTPRKGWAAN